METLQIPPDQAALKVGMLITVREGTTWTSTALSSCTSSRTSTLSTPAKGLHCKAHKNTKASSLHAEINFPTITLYSNLN
jgi:hypothetical protein